MRTDKDTRHPIEILAPEGPHKTISIAAEQAAPMADLATFTEQLSSFTREDYYGDAPYDLLVRSSQFSWNQYDQFAAVLIKAAYTAGVEKGTAEAAVQMYRDVDGLKETSEKTQRYIREYFGMDALWEKVREDFE